MNSVSNSIHDRKRLFALAAMALAVTLVSGAVYGRWTQRWGPPADLEAAGEGLSALPRQIGDWRMLEERPMEDAVREILQCAGSLIRVYVHQATGATVNVAVIVGPPGPTAVHTPEICYSSRDFDMSGPSVKSSFHPPDGSTHSLWTTTFQSRNAGGQLLQVYYGWSPGDRWIASDSPRFEFGGNKLLYKIQVAALIGHTSDDDSIDPCRSFLDALLQTSWNSPDASLRQH